MSWEKLVNIDKIKELILKTKVPFTDGSFYPRLFNLIVKEKRVSKNALQSICEEEYGDISRRADLSNVQESVSIRNVLRTRKLASYLVNDKGEISLEDIDAAIQYLKNSLYSLGPDRQNDACREELVLNVLMKLKEDRDLFNLLKNVSKPHQSRDIEEIIRCTLDLPQNMNITDVHAKRAVFSSLICYLRQSVGSCFGTAPAIIIHDEQPKQFLRDINELFGTGQLKRTFGGVEYSVPISSSWGIGNLKKQLVFGEAIPDEISFCPGLINALEAASLFSENFKLKDKIAEARKGIGTAYQKLKGPNQYVVTNMEELLRTILLNHFNLKEEDLANYLRREKLTHGASLFVQMPSSVPATSQNVEKFIKQFESAKTAFKALEANALLKSWEFTLASFSENKAGFTTWNLYSSLGFKQNEKGGLGETLYQILKDKLDESNRKVHDFQDEYDQAYSHVKYLETRMRTASTEKDIEWMKIEYQSKVNEFHFLEEMRNKLHNKAKRLANLFDLLIDIFMYFFPQYFQEVYDASMHDITPNQYDDSPAGFRLLYKYGRGNTAQWKQIYTADEFTEALISFFTSTESEIKNSADMEGLEEEFSEIVTAIVLKIRSPEFLETAFARMAAAHHTAIISNPLANLDKIEKKPWAYVSGGSMVTLVSTYYRREGKPNEVSRWVESPTELLNFLLDMLKQLPKDIKEEYSKNSNKSMLMHSPTHAFLLKPGFPLFKNAWQSDLFTYTYIRDKIILPRERFIRQMILDEEMMDFFIEELIAAYPDNYRETFRSSLKPIYKTLSPPEFREHLLDQLRRDRKLSYHGRPLFSKETIDSQLYSMLPLFPISELKKFVEAVFNELPKDPDFAKEKFDEVFESIYYSGKNVRIISSTKLQEVCKLMICLLKSSTSFPINYHSLIAKACQNLGLSMPEPLLIADTNWVKDYFGFTVNPGTCDFEFWRFDPTATIGSPMAGWESWLNGTRRDLTWGVLNRPHEYHLT